MDFKIEEIDEEEKSKKTSNNNLMPIIIVVIIALIVGLLVFLVSNKAFGKKEKKPEPVTETKLKLTEDNVEILYAYVTYGTKNIRNEKFIKEKNVDINSFTNDEKFYYALQFAQVEDFQNDGELDKDNKKIYYISANKIKTYMQRFFGSKVTYSLDTKITYPFSFRINGQNVGKMTYSEEDNGFDTIFDGYEPEEEDKRIVKPYYAELTAAYKEADGTYRLEEKIIYTTLEQDGNYYKVGIYRDYEHTELIESRMNLTEEELKSNPIELKKYIDKASTITYHFNIDLNNTLYFDKSSIR